MKAIGVRLSNNLAGENGARSESWQLTSQETQGKIFYMAIGVPAGVF